MAKKSVKDYTEFAGKKVLVRVDFNVPLKDGKITDDRRIVSALPTIKYLLEQNAKVILMSHLGRPKGERVPELSLKPAAERLSVLLGKSVAFADDCIGEPAEKVVAQLGDGEVAVLENLRYHNEEIQNDDVFAQQLAAFGEVYVNDAFGTAHRAHASTEGVTRFLFPCLAGCLIEKELQYLGQAVANPEKPFMAILGGAKVSDKIKVIENLLDKVDILAVGGAMVYTFLKAQGKPIGKSLVEDAYVELAAKLLKDAATKGVEFILPVDHIVAKELSADALSQVVKEIPEDQMGLDIGPESIKIYVEAISKARTVVWNGPMGVFEIDTFARGTMAVAKALADSSAISVIGGGDSSAAIEKAGCGDRITHISTGGGASLEFLEGKVLPGIDALDEA